MAEAFFRVQVGDLVCTIVSDGARVDPLEKVYGLFVNKTEEEVRGAVSQVEYNDETVTDDLNCFVVKSDEATLLVDVGMGDMGKPDRGHLLERLEEAGFTPEDIDIVFISHFHGDHFIALTHGEDNAVTFPNARYVCTQKEWDAWMSDEALASMEPPRAAMFTDRFGKLKDQFSFVNAGDEVIDGVQVIDAPGHTPGHAALLIHSSGEQLLAMVDLLHKFVQFEYPDFHHKFDGDGVIASGTRKKLLARAADENLLTLFYHLPFPGLGYVSKNYDDTFEWNPISSQ